MFHVLHTAAGTGILESVRSNSCLQIILQSISTVIGNKGQWIQMWRIICWHGAHRHKCLKQTKSHPWRSWPLWSNPNLPINPKKAPLGKHCNSKFHGEQNRSTMNGHTGAPCTAPELTIHLDSTTWDQDTRSPRWEPSNPAEIFRGGLWRGQQAPSKVYGHGCWIVVCKNQQCCMNNIFQAPSMCSYTCMHMYYKYLHLSVVIPDFDVADIYVCV